MSAAPAGLLQNPAAMVQLRYPFSLRELTSTTLFLVCLLSALWYTDVLRPLALSCAAALAAAAAWSALMYRTQAPPPASLVVVTGCSSGMGRALAQDLSASGVHVVAGVRRREDAERLRKELPAACSKFLHPVILDVTDAQHIAEAVRSTAKLLREKNLVLHGLVNNAGYPETGPVELVPLERARYQFEVNVFGPMALTNEFLPLLRESADRLPKGHTPRVVFVSSVVGKFSLPLLGVYCASKHALEALGDGYRRELSAWGIDVVLVQPGATATQFVPKFETNLHKNRGGEHQSAVAKVYERAQRRLLSAASLTLYGTPELVLRRMRGALYDATPYPRYTVGLDCDGALTVAKHLPDILLDKVFQFACGLLPGSAAASAATAAAKSASSAAAGSHRKAGEVGEQKEL